MAAPIALVPDEEISRAELAEGLAELNAALPAYGKAHDYYVGDIEELFDSIKLRQKLRYAAREFNINFASVPVDAVANRLKIASVTAGDDAASAALHEHWAENKLDLFLPKALLDMCKMGDGYLITWPREYDEDGALAVRLDTWINDARTCRLFYDEERPLVKRFGIKRWRTTSKAARVDLYFPDRIEKLITKKGTEGKSPDDFVPYRDSEDDAWPYDNPTGEVPMFHLRNDAPYGVPEHERFYGTQNIITKLIVSHMGSVDYQALPQRYTLAEAGAGQPDASAVDPDLFAIDTTATDADDEPLLDSRPGGLWNLVGKKAVGQFDAAPPNVFTDPMLTYLRMGAQITDTPTHKIDPTGTVPSGASLRTAEGPLIHKTENRQRWVESTVEEWAGFVLRQLGYDDVTVTVRWEPAETTDDEASWAVAQQKIEAGVPVQQVLVEQGYDPTQVETWLGDFDPDSERDAKVLLAFGQALTALGTAKNLGVLSDDQVAELIAAVIEDVDDAAE